MALKTQCFGKNKYISISGIIGSILGILLILLKPWIIELLRSNVLVLESNSVIENVWRRVPDVPLNFYLFNWTNPEDFHDLGIRPKFQEVGPFKFKENIEKVDVTWNMNNTVTYSLARYIHYDESANNKNLSEPITLVNGITLCIAHYIRYMNYPIKALLSAYIFTAAPYIHLTKSIKELLFDGFDDFIIDLGSYFPFLYSDIPRFDKFSLLTIANGSKEFEGVFNIKNNIDGIFDVHNWNFANLTPFFNGPCSKIQGSTGELFSKPLSKDYIDIFLSAICRNIRLDFEEEVTVRGIVGYKYSVGDGMLDNGTLIPGNECYCNGDCVPSGMVNMSSCRYDLPIFLSLPNFYGADPVYLEDIESAQPYKDKHEAYIIIEPNTGVPLKAAVRVQVNLLVHPIEDISVFEDVRKVFFPILWLEQNTTLPDHVYVLLKIYVVLPHVIIAVGSILAIIGMVLLCVPLKPALVSWLKKLKEQKRNNSPIPEEVPLQHENQGVKTIVNQSITM